MNAPEPEPSRPRATRPHRPRPPRGEGLRGIRNALPADWDDQIDLVAIVKLDSGGNIRGWNLGAERIKGYTEAEVLGSHFCRFYREEDRRRGRPDRLLAAAQRDGHVEDTGWRVRRDGQEFWAWVTITAIRSDRGEVLGFVKLVRDLTAERRAEEERATAQRAFAHDLVSPLTALRGYLDLLAEDMPADHHVLDAASQVTDHLVAMAQALAASAAATTEHTRRRAPLDLIVRGAAALVLPGHAGARLVFGEMSPVVIDGDVLALRRAIANVVENAAKYSDEAITIEVSAKEADAVVVIRDRGRGIHPDDLAAVLEEGVRGRLADSRDGGSGLGLASVKRIIDEHGGTVRIDSVVGEGTTVTLTVPGALG